MKLFVTGACGFIGGHFVEHAVSIGHQVIGLRREDRASQSLHTHLESLGVRMITGDLLEDETPRDELDGVDCVVHFAAAFREAGADEDYFRRVNVEGTAQLLAAAHAHGVKRFVLCSTAGIYGQRVEGVIDETNSVAPWNAYERSKIDAESEVRTRARDSGIEYVILRPTAVYGPRDQRLLKLFQSAARGRFPLFGSGDGRRHMVYVSDLVDAFVRACTRPGAANQEMIVAGPEAVSLHAMLSTLAGLAKRKSSGPRLPLRPMLRLAAFTEDFCNRFKINPPLYRRRMDFYTNDAEFDSSHAQRVLGWKPLVPLREGLARTLRSHQEPRIGPSLSAFGWLGSALPFAYDSLRSLAMASMFTAESAFW